MTLALERKLTIKNSMTVNNNLIKKHAESVCRGCFGASNGDCSHCTRNKENSY